MGIPPEIGVTLIHNASMHRETVNVGWLAVKITACCAL